MEINERQKRFCEEYVKDYNAAQSAIRAGYSAKSARSQAYELLTKPHIQAYLSGLQREHKADNKRWIKDIVNMRSDCIPVLRGLLQSTSDTVRLRVCELLLQLDKLDLTNDEEEELDF